MATLCYQHAPRPSTRPSPRTAPLRATTLPTACELLCTNTTHAVHTACPRRALPLPPRSPPPASPLVLRHGLVLGQQLLVVGVPRVRRGVVGGVRRQHLVVPAPTDGGTQQASFIGRQLVTPSLYRRLDIVCRTSMSRPRLGLCACEVLRVRGCQQPGDALAPRPPLSFPF